MRLTVIGTGYLGTAHAACLTELGFDVLGVDTNYEQISMLTKGDLPFHEPHLKKLLKQGVSAGRLHFTTSYQEAAAFGDVHFICVGTPQRARSGGTDLSQLNNCIDSLAPMLTRRCLIVGKSTVPPGTAASLAERVALLAPASADVELSWNPEFLREGHAVADTLQPERIIVGVRSTAAEQTLREIYAEPIAAGVPFISTDLASAELTKMAANAFLATKISFINAMAEVCDVAGADVISLARALGYDHRIGHSGMCPGVGFGGGCLPKDLRGFLAWAAETGTPDAISFLEQMDMINMRSRSRLVQLTRQLAGGHLAGSSIGVLGLAFKPDSDDIRESPALYVATDLYQRGAHVTAYDPSAVDRARKAHPELAYAASTIDAAADADVMLLLTDWPEFREADPQIIGKAVAKRNIVDGRHALDQSAWQAAGWNYRAPGRPSLDGEVLSNCIEKTLSLQPFDGPGQPHHSGRSAVSSRESLRGDLIY